MLVRFVLAAALIVSGCSRKENPETKITKEGVDVNKDPLGMISAIASAGKEAEEWQKELEKMPATDPVHFSKLIEALPAAPSGWTAGEAKGSINQMGDFKTSHAERTYTKEGTNERVEVSLDDWAFHRTIYLPFIMSAKFSQESTDGYNKGITIGKDPGREEYRIKSKSGSRIVLFKKRYHAKVDIDNLGSEAFEEWWGRLNVGALP